MRKFLMYLSMIISLNAFGQHSYEIVIDTEDDLKTSLSNITKGYLTYDKFVADTIRFSSTTNLSESDIDSLCNIYNYELLYYKKDKTYTYVYEKAGNTDCEGAIQLCDNTSFNGNSSNNSYQDLNTSNQGCLTFGEQQPNWFYINIETGGTLEMTLDPNTNADIDFAIWGPFTAANANANCPPITSPVRCSWAATYGNTGMINCAPGSGQGCYNFTHNVNDNSEGVSGDAWVLPLNTNAGEVYILLVDNFSQNGNYNLTWEEQLF